MVSGRDSRSPIVYSVAQTGDGTTEGYTSKWLFLGDIDSLSNSRMLFRKGSC